MKTNKSTHITMLLDRSGSMASIRDDIIGGFNMFIEQQKKSPGETTVTLVQFDTEDPFEVVFSFRNLAEAPPLTALTYVPRGGTPLLDAVGRTINNLTAWLGEQEKNKRPDNIIVVIITDGQENSSREFDKKQITRMIAEKEKLLNWQFVYLSADLDAIHEAMGLGIAFHHSMAYDKNAHGTRQALKSLSLRISEVRSGLAPRVMFNKDDRAQQDLESQRNK